MIETFVSVRCEQAKTNYETFMVATSSPNINIAVLFACCTPLSPPTPDPHLHASDWSDFTNEMSKRMSVVHWLKTSFQNRFSW